MPQKVTESRGASLIVVEGVENPCRVVNMNRYEGTKILTVDGLLTMKIDAILVSTVVANTTVSFV